MTDVLLGPILHDTAYAKVNLALHVRARQADGYHVLDTLFAFVDDGDKLSVELDNSLTLKITGPYSKGLSNGGDNLILKAAMALQSHFDVKQGAAITLDKRLPVASGIGGGSADAAASARLLNRLWNLKASYGQLAEILAPLGADIPACIASETARGHGIGTSLQIIPDSNVENLPILLVNPNIALATGPVFSKWNGLDGGALYGADVYDMMMKGNNDLQSPAIDICPEISGVIDLLRSQNPLLARMSGSGATCFALFTNMDECIAANNDIKISVPGFWTMMGRLR
jgi:4-diphosphocytidyl-2-C-methyl-D-erythritol kinase